MPASVPRLRANCNDERDAGRRSRPSIANALLVGKRFMKHRTWPREKDERDCRTGDVGPQEIAVDAADLH